MKVYIHILQALLYAIYKWTLTLGAQVQLGSLPTYNSPLLMRLWVGIRRKDGSTSAPDTTASVPLLDRSSAVFLNPGVWLLYRQ